MKKRVWLVLLFMGLLIAATAEAEQPVVTAQTNDVFVTATRTEQQLDKIGGSSVTVITAEEIEAKNQTSISEVLRGIQGLDISRNGGPGAQTNVSLRGSDNKNTLILIDGMMLNDPSSTNRIADIANLITDGVERIEVVRGPMSVLYGSNATAGVINIITQKGQDKPSILAVIEGGSYNTWKYSASVQGAIDKFNFALLGASLNTDGFSNADKDNPDIPHAGNTDEDDGWENNSVYGKFGFDITPDFDISANFLYYDAEVDLDDWDWSSGYAGDRFDTDFETWLPTASPNGTKKYKTESDHTGGKLNVHNFFFSRRLESTLSFSASRTKSTTFDNDGNEWFDYEGKTREWTWQGGFNLGTSNIINVGMNYFLEEMDSNSDGIEDVDADTKSIWIQDQLLLGENFVFVVGLRNDDHENFGNKSTYRLSPAWHINNTTLKASYGTGFRSPSLYELYSVYGNEDLDAEESYGWDIGIEQVVDVFTFGLTYFALTFDDRIDWDPNRIIPDSPWPGGYNQVDGKSKTKGVEAFITFKPVSNMDMRLNYTYTDTKDAEDVHLVRRPYNKFHLNTLYRFMEKGQMNMDVIWVGERDAITTAMDKNGNPVNNLDAYTLVNLSAQYDVNDFLKLYARIDNLFDEYYEESWSYATPGLSGYLGMKIRY